MISAVALSPGTRKLGPGDGRIEVHTYREGMAQKIGHDLIIEVAQWTAAVEVGEDGSPSAIEFEVDPRSLKVREGVHGVKPLSDKDRAGIEKDIDGQILHGQPIVFRSSAVEGGGPRLSVRGELTMAGTTKPASFDLDLAADGRVSGTLSVTQSQWGIKQYKSFMGALKVRDAVEVVLDVALPA
jgi:polyisoprenoid-binding protein YceI